MPVSAIKMPVSGMEAPEPWVVEVPDGKSWTVAARADGVYGHEYLALEGLQGFGGGLAVGEVCGALSGAAAALGLLSDPVPPGDFGAKMAFSEKTKALAEAFREGAGSLRCADMRPEDLEARKAVCGGYIRLGVKLAAEALMK